MWHTNYGDRTLEGAEALRGLVSSLEVDESDYDMGLEVFDRLTYEQKVSLFSIIGAGLLKLDVPIRKLAAIVESAIAMVFDHLKMVVIVEIYEPEFIRNDSA